jgi:hypothetical protein
MSSHADESGHHSDLCGICLVAAFVVWRSGTLGSISEAAGNPRSHERAHALCAAFRALRGPRFSRGPDRAMLSVANAPWKLSTKDPGPLQFLSWPCLSMTGCPPVRRSRAFWRRWPRSPSKPCAHSFSMIYSVVHSSPTPTPTRSKREDWWIARETPG